MTDPILETFRQLGEAFDVLLGESQLRLSVLEDCTKQSLPALGILVRGDHHNLFVIRQSVANINRHVIERGVDVGFWLTPSYFRSRLLEFIDADQLASLIPAEASGVFSVTGNGTPSVKFSGTYADLTLVDDEFLVTIPVVFNGLYGSGPGHVSFTGRVVLEPQNPLKIRLTPTSAVMLHSSDGENVVFFVPTRDDPSASKLSSSRIRQLILESVAKASIDLGGFLPSSGGTAIKIPLGSGEVAAVPFGTACPDRVFIAARTVRRYGAPYDLTYSSEDSHDVGVLFTSPLVEAEVKRLLEPFRKHGKVEVRRFEFEDGHAVMVIHAEKRSFTVDVDIDAAFHIFVERPDADADLVVAMHGEPAIRVDTFMGCAEGRATRAVHKVVNDNRDTRVPLTSPDTNTIAAVSGYVHQSGLSLWLTVVRQS